MKVSHEKQCGYYIHPYYWVPPQNPIVVTAHQCSKMPQSYYLPSQCYTVFPWFPHTMCANYNNLNPLVPSSPPALPHCSPLESVNLLLFCSFSFALLLYSTNEENHLIWYLSFSAWLISLSIISSSSIHVVANGRFSSYGWIVFYCVYVPHSSLSIPLLMDT